MIKKSNENNEEKSKLDLLVLKYQLTTDEEVKKDVLNQMIEENKGFIIEIANKYNCEFFDYGDLYDAGVVGFIEAANRYIPNDEAKFSTYAYKYIHGIMKNYVRKVGRDMPLPYHVHKNYIKYREVICNITKDCESKKPTDKELLKYMAKHKIPYRVNQTDYEWDMEKVKLMRIADAQAETIHYNNHVSDDGESEMCDLIEDNTLETPVMYAEKNMYNYSLEEIFNRYNSLNDDNVIDIIKLRNGIFDERTKSLVIQTVNRVGKERFGTISDSGKLTLDQLSLIFNKTGEYVRIISETGVRRLQIQEGLDPTLSIRQGYKYKFIHKDLNIKPMKLKTFTFTGYDKKIISIDQKTGYIDALKEGKTKLVVTNPKTNNSITYDIVVEPKYKYYKNKKCKVKKELTLRKEANNE